LRAEQNPIKTVLVGLRTADQYMSKIILLTLVLLFSSSSNLLAAPKADLWERWTAHNPASSNSIDHKQWSELLRRYLYVGEDAIHRFAYDKVGKDDRESLDRYIERLAETGISDYKREVQRAYWINLYNALTVREVLRFFPIDSIRDISSGFFSAGPWKKKLLVVEGQDLTLNDIEHRILRPIWRDPRIHYAVNCASLGCPNLPVTAFTEDNTDAMLERAAREFINHPRAVAVIDGELQVSSIYEWFKADFGDNDAGVIGHLEQYANIKLARELSSISRIESDQYDWHINSTDQQSGLQLVTGNI